MIAADLRQVAAWTGGRLGDGAARVTFRGVSSDTRTLQPGNLFVALDGPNFDGRDFVADAFARGAAGAVVAGEPIADGPCVAVDGTRRALGAIGRGWRAGFDGLVIAVTGSNGKTTVKEAIAAILRVDGEVLATRGNLNNDIGLPLMLCELDPRRHEAAVFELGSNHPGEISELARLCRPAIGVVTNSDAAHLEGFGTQAAVAAGNAELYAELPSDGSAVLPVADPFVDTYRAASTAGRSIDYAADADATVRVRPAESGIAIDWPGASRRCAFALPGAHNRHNAAAAAATALAAGRDLDSVATGLAALGPVAGRLVRRTGIAGATLLDDTYNANPGSFRAALAVLGEAHGHRWAVVGEMGELGQDALAAHRDLGHAAREAGVERLWAYGPSAEATREGFGPEAEVVTEPDALAQRLAGELGPGVCLLVKGSRSNRLERVVDALLAGAEEGRDAV